MKDDLVEKVWYALLHRCAAHRPKDHDEVKRLVLVTKADIRAALVSAGEK
jgi:hypothetical protein